MLKIYGAGLSAPANKVRMAANAMDLSYDYVRINIRDGEHQKKEYLQIHPAGKIPAIDDDGFVLFESDAIIKYLAGKTGSGLYPEDLRQRALIDQWMDFTAIHVGGAMAKVLFNRVFAPAIGAPVDERSIDDGVKFLSRFLPVIDRQLAKAGHLAGAEFSLADIALLATLDPMEAAQVDIGPYAHIGRWRQTLMREEFYAKCHASYGDVLRQMMAGK